MSRHMQSEVSAVALKRLQPNSGLYWLLAALVIISMLVSAVGGGGFAHAQAAVSFIAHEINPAAPVNVTPLNPDPRIDNTPVPAGVPAGALVHLTPCASFQTKFQTQIKTSSRTCYTFGNSKHPKGGTPWNWTTLL